MDLKFPVYHVIVVGFHHKMGCQIEFAYPPLEIEIEKSAWKHLPTLAMPDGAHNYDHDTVYFHLPSLKNPNETIFGVACYQQINANQLKYKPDDVTRSTVQKSVCVLSRYPLYGHIQVKMSLITAAYFREGDFNQVSILEEAFHNLNACLTPELLLTPEAFVGLSPRELVFLFRHQVIILFKLLLLEKRILFRGSSVGPLCSALLSLVSLIPQSLEFGLNKSACIRTEKTLSIVPQFSGDGDGEIDEADIDINILQQKENVKNGKEKDKNSGSASASSSSMDHSGLYEQLNKKEKLDVDEKDLIDKADNNSNSTPTPTSENIPSGLTGLSGSGSNNELSVFFNNSKEEKDKNQELVAKIKFSESESSLVEKCEEVPDFVTAVQMTSEDAGLPLNIFQKGYLCHPYLSLHYMDLLTDRRVKGYLVGATNILFKQKKDLFDAIVEMQDGSIEIFDPILKKTVSPSVPDLRFIENIVKQVTQESNRRSDIDAFLDGIGWEGGDEWIRAQFKYYMICLMRTSLLEDGNRKRDSFNPQFLAGWQNTNHWKIWNEYINSEDRDTPGVYSLCPGHPFEGQMSMNDMKIKFSHTIQNTEGGRKLNQAVVSTGKAVGGALSQAKGAFSSWWSTMVTPPENNTNTEQSSIPAASSSTSTNATTDNNKDKDSSKEKVSIADID